MDTETLKKTHIWDSLKRPPPSALKKISGGRLSGMTDISPQWRYQVMTEQFGACGSGWRYEIIETWSDEGSDSQVAIGARINLFIKVNKEWSEAIPGIGGSMLVTQEQKGLHTSDEAYKMAVTDALSVAMKMLGVAADIYAGLWDGSKYKTDEEQREPGQKPKTRIYTPTEIVNEAKKKGYVKNGDTSLIQAIMVREFKVKKVSDLSPQHRAELMTLMGNSRYLGEGEQKQLLIKEDTKVEDMPY